MLPMEFVLTDFIIRNLDIELQKRLRARAASHGRSMEDEAREILSAALSIDAAPSRTLAEAIRARIASLGAVELELPQREPMPPPITFE